MAGGGRWRVWSRWAPWRGSRCSRPLTVVLDAADGDIDALALACLLIAVPLLVVVAIEQTARALLTPVAVLVRYVAGLPRPVEITVRGRRRWAESMVLAPDPAAARRICFAVAAHLGAGRDLGDPRFQQWLAEAGGRFVPDRRVRVLRRFVRGLRGTARA